MGLQPRLDGLDNQVMLLRFSFWEGKERGNGNVRGDQVLSAFSTHPQHGPVALAIPVGILYRQLRFADASQATDRLGLRERHGLTGLELTAQTDKQVLTSQEEGIAGVRDIPDDRQGRT